MAEGMYKRKTENKMESIYSLRGGKNPVNRNLTDHTAESLDSRTVHLQLSPLIMLLVLVIILITTESGIDLGILKSLFVGMQKGSVTKCFLFYRNWTASRFPNSVLSLS